MNIMINKIIDTNLTKYNFLKFKYYLIKLNDIFDLQ